MSSNQPGEPVGKIDDAEPGDDVLIQRAVFDETVHGDSMADTTADPESDHEATGDNAS
jgi:hypothetical protein